MGAKVQPQLRESMIGEQATNMSTWYMWVSIGRRELQVLLTETLKGSVPSRALEVTTRLILGYGGCNLHNNWKIISIISA